MQSSLFGMEQLRYIIETKYAASNCKLLYCIFELLQTMASLRQTDTNFKVFSPMCFEREYEN